MSGSLGLALEASMASILDICASLPRVVIPRGSNVIEQGKRRGSLFILVEGSVLVERDGVTLAELERAGTIFGEMSSLLDRPAATTVRTTVDSTFLMAEDGAAFLAATPDAVIEVARALAVRIEMMTSYLAEVKHQFAEQEGHLSMVDDVMKTLIHDTLPEVQPGSVRMPEIEY